MCSESEARRIIGPDGAGQLIEIVEGGWKQYMEDGRARRSTPRANVVWDNMMTIAEDEFAQRDDVRVVPLHQSQGFVLKDLLLIRFKKLDRDRMPRNYPTSTQQRLAQSGMFDDMPELVPVTCGYLLDATESEVHSIFVSRIVNNHTEWSIDLYELAAGVLAPASPIFDDLATNIPALPTIRRPRRVKEGDKES